MNVFFILAIIFTVLFIFTLSLMFLSLPDIWSKIIVGFGVVLTIGVIIFVACGFVVNDEKNREKSCQELFVEENFKETINYEDFINIDYNKQEIKYLKDGSYLTMRYKWKADDFDVKNGIQVYVDSFGTVGIR